MSSEVSSLWRDARRWLPGVVISMVALFVIFKLASWPDLIAAMITVKIPNLSIAIVLTIISLGTRAMAWRTLLNGKPTFKQSFYIINEGYLLNSLFPLRAGEIGRAIFMGQASGLGPLHVLSTIVIERAFDLAFAAGLLLTTLPLALGMSWAKPVALGTLGLVLAGLISLFLMARYNYQLKLWIGRIGNRSPIVQRLVIPRIGSLLEGLGVLTQPSQFLLSLFWIFCSWVIWVMTHYVMLISIVPGAPVWWAAFIDSVLAMGVAIPSAPAALGVFEAALTGSLTLLGVSYNIALAYAIVMHFLNFLSTAIFGFWGLMQERRSLSGILSQLKL